MHDLPCSGVVSYLRSAVEFSTCGIVALVLTRMSHFSMRATRQHMHGLHTGTATWAVGHGSSCCAVCTAMGTGQAG